MRARLEDEKGMAVIEATLLLPFCMIMVLALFYAAIFMCQRANLQANVQNALLYYKNVDSDNYVEAKANMQYTVNGNQINGAGSSYGTPQYKFPYRFLSMKFDRSGFASFFRSMCGQMFFDHGSNVKLEVSSKNYIIYKTISATATQTVRPAIRLSIVGGSDEMKIRASGVAVIMDGDDFIRNTDFVINIVSQTQLGKKASEMVDKGIAYYNKFKQKFGVG